MLIYLYTPTPFSKPIRNKTNTIILKVKKSDGLFLLKSLFDLVIVNMLTNN